MIWSVVMPVFSTLVELIRMGRLSDQEKDLEIPAVLATSHIRSDLREDFLVRLLCADTHGGDLVWCSKTNLREEMSTTQCFDHWFPRSKTVVVAGLLVCRNRRTSIKKAGYGTARFTLT